MRKACSSSCIVDTSVPSLSASWILLAASWWNADSDAVGFEVECESSEPTERKLLVRSDLVPVFLVGSSASENSSSSRSECIVDIELSERLGRL